jgi:type VI secretion system secreted protein VgrG
MSRTLTVNCPAIPSVNGTLALLPIRLTGEDGLNRLHDFRITLSTPDEVSPYALQHNNFSLDSFIGQPLTVIIEQDEGTREITGLITEAYYLHQEGRNVLYQLHLKPWLHLATLTSDCKIFQDLTVQQILQQLFQDYAFPVEYRLQQKYPVRDYQVQFNETDFAFFERLAQEWGLNYFFDYKGGKQILVISDSIAAHPFSSCNAYANLTFNAMEHRVGEEYLGEFNLVHRLVTGVFTSRDYDYTRPASDLSVSSREARPTLHAEQEQYEWHASAHYVQPQAGSSQKSNLPLDEGNLLGNIRVDGLVSSALLGQGLGTLRGMQAGYRFVLKEHPQQKANTEYLILSSRLEITEVEDETRRVTLSREPTYIVKAQFQAYPCKDTPYYRPQLTRQKPSIYGPHHAVVVGAPNAPIHTDQYGRIKVQFPWDRYGQRNENSSCWVRVAAPFSGNQMGMMNLPRIGQEVLIEFIGGDPDLPICTAQVHNQLNMPAWELPSQLSLSGFRSREIIGPDGNSSGARSNHLILDDTQGKIQSQLRSDHDHSQLSLGHITRIETTAGRTDPRGEGFELRTDGHGVVRAMNGLLLTTEPRPAAREHLTDMPETVSRLEKAHEQQKALAQLAEQQGAQENNQQQQSVAKELAEHTKAIKGKGPTDKANGLFPELEEPHLVLASPAGIHTTTPRSTHIAADEHIALTSGDHTTLAVGKGLFATIIDTFRLFVQKAGMKLIAAGGDIDVQALQKNINLLAKLQITETAEEIIITGKKAVRINGAGSYIELKAGQIELGTGTFNIFANVNINPPKQKSADLPPIPKPGKGNLDLNHKYANGEGLKNSDFKIIDALGKEIAGKLDASGFASVAGLFPGPVKVFFGKEPRSPWDDSSSYFGKPTWPPQMPDALGSDPGLGGLMNLRGKLNDILPSVQNKLQGMLSTATSAAPTSIASVLKSPLASMGSPTFVAPLEARLGEGLSQVAEQLPANFLPLAKALTDNKPAAILATHAADQIASMFPSSAGSLPKIAKLTAPDLARHISQPVGFAPKLKG